MPWKSRLSPQGLLTSSRNGADTLPTTFSVNLASARSQDCRAARVRQGASPAGAPNAPVGSALRKKCAVSTPPPRRGGGLSRPLALPQEGSGHGVRFFDWDCWRVDLGADDLAYMMALHWYPELRRRYEPLLLDRYSEALVTHGVHGYDRRALQEDYRLAVLWQMATPVWQAAHDIPPVIWWNNFERIMLAVDDLGCRELLA